MNGVRAPAEAPREAPREAEHAAPHETVTPVLERPLAQPTPPRRWRDRLAHQWQLARRPRLESAWASRCGTSHSRNQDAVCDAAPFFAVADGVGGGAAGEVASSELLAWLRRVDRSTWRNSARLAHTLAQADTQLAQKLATLNLGGPSATTFVAAWLAPSGRARVAHVGDSRALLLQPGGGRGGYGRNGIGPDGAPASWRVTRLTEDHTSASLGETPPSGGHRGDPARMVGVGAMGVPGLATHALQEGDWLLLCSDGLHRFVSEPQLARLCQNADQAAHESGARSPDQSPRLSPPQPPPSPLAALAQTLVQAAVQAGSADDVSVLLLRRNPRWGARWPFWWAALLAVAVAVAVAGAGAVAVAVAVAVAGSAVAWRSVQLEPAPQSPVQIGQPTPPVRP